jgi:subtilisin family serine protease
MKLSCLVGAVMFASLSFASTIPFSNFTTDKMFVKVQSGETLPSSKFIKSSKKVFDGLYIVETENVILLEKELSSNKAVKYTQKNYIRQRVLGERTEAKEFMVQEESGATFNDPSLSKQWSLAGDSGHGVSMLKHYEQSNNAALTTTIVAVVDTGVQVDHEDLKDVVWVNEGEIAGNGIDDDQNGYIDDVNGINTLKRVDGVPTGDISDGHGHGSHVSGIIGATQNNNIGIAGIASAVQIMGIRTVPNNGDETDVDVVESYMYAAKMGAKIINCSFGKSNNEGGQVVNETIDYIGSNHDVLVVAAAGNDTSNIDNKKAYPASFESDYLLVVASTTKSMNGSLSYFSNYGSDSVDLAAPGSSIYSTVSGNSYASYSGTSMASPTAAGVAAQVRSTYPELTALEIKKALMNSVTPVSKFKGKMLSAGRVNLVKALEAAANM